jgi:hypothetical protein
MSYLVLRSENGAFWNTLTFGVFFRGNMPGKLLILAPLLLLTACRQEQLLPVAHAAGQEEFRSSVQPASAVQQAPTVQSTSTTSPSTQIPKATRRPGLHDSCYAYMMMRPKSQREDAVQARLNKADAIEAAFSAQTVDVDLMGDHANILALQFPVVWPDKSRADRVSSVLEEYLSTPDVLDYMCNAGFAKVSLSARGLNDGRLHELWTAHVTAEGLVKDRHTGDAEPDAKPEQAATEPVPPAQTISYLKPD